jgi:hypothetical protein
MNVLYSIHALVGERILPLLIVLTAIWLTVRWRPGARPDIVARIFPVLVDIQVTLGIIYFIYGLVAGRAGAYLSFPFILHPILGVLAAGIAHMGQRGRGPGSGLGRWAPLVSLGLLLVIVLVNIMLANAV